MNTLFAILCCLFSGLTTTAKPIDSASPKPFARDRYDLFDFTEEEHICWQNAQLYIYYEKDNTFDRLQKEHGRIGPVGHQPDANFTMVHKWMLLDWEDALLDAAKELGCTFPGLPYYDVGLRAHAWEKNETLLFTDDYIGTCPDGQACVTGPFSRLAFDHEGQENVCVVRDCSNLASMVPYQTVNSTLERMSRWDDAGGLLLLWNHMRGHIQVGGHMGIGNQSARDVFFWLLHAYIDRDFNFWLNPPRDSVYHVLRSASPEALNATRIPFYNVTYQEVFDREAAAQVIYHLPDHREGIKNKDTLEWEPVVSTEDVLKGQPTEEQIEKATGQDSKDITVPKPQVETGVDLLANVESSNPTSEPSDGSSTSNTTKKDTEKDPSSGASTLLHAGLNAVALFLAALVAFCLF